MFDLLDPILIGTVSLTAATLGSLRLYTALTVDRVERKYPPAGAFFTAANIKMHYIEKGSGPAVVLLHGDGGSVNDFLMSPIFDRLAESYRVIAIDRPGFGFSQRPDQDAWSPYVQAGLIHAVLKHLGVVKPVLVGHSRGGTVALAYTMVYPEEVAATVTLAGGAYAHADKDPLMWLMISPLIGSLLANTLVVPFGRARHFQRVKQGLDQAFAPESETPQDYLKVYASHWLRPVTILSAAEDRVLGEPVKERMQAGYARISRPLVIIQGNADRNVAPSQAARLHAEVPHSHLILVPGAGHELMFHHPNVVQQGIQQAWELSGVKPANRIAG